MFDEGLADRGGSGSPGSVGGSDDPPAFDPFKSNGEIDDEILTQIIRDMASEDPAVANAALQALTRAWARADQEHRGPEFSAKVDEANRRVLAERSVQPPDQQDDEAPAAPQPRRAAADAPVANPAPTGTGTAPRTNVVPFVAATGNQGLTLGGFGESGILFTGTSLADVAVGAPILSAVRFSPPPVLEGAPVLPTADDHAGEGGTSLVRTASLPMDGASPTGANVPMLVTASGSPVPLAPFSVEVPLFPSAALSASLNTAPDDRYFAILFGSQAVSSPFMRVLTSPTPAEMPIVRRARERVSQILAERQSALALSAYSVPGSSQTTTLAFACDPRNGQMIVAVGPVGMRLNDLLANAAAGGHGPLTRRALARGAGPISLFSHARHFEDHDLSLPSGVFVSYIPIHQYMTFGRPLAPGVTGAMLTRGKSAVTEDAVAEIGSESGSTDHQQGEGGQGGGYGGEGGESGDRGRRQNQGEERLVA